MKIFWFLPGLFLGIASSSSAETLPPIGKRIYIVKTDPAVPPQIILESDTNLRKAQSREGIYLKDPGFPETFSQKQSPNVKKVAIAPVQQKRDVNMTRKKKRSGRSNHIGTGETYFTAKARFPRARLEQERMESHIQEAPIRIDYLGRTQASERQLSDIKQ